MATKIPVRIWHQRVQRALDLQEKHSKERLEISRLYRGVFLGNPFDKTSRKSELNFLFEYVRLVKGATYARNPHIFVRAPHSDFVAFAETMEQVLNYYVTELKTKPKVKSSVADAIMQPPGFIKIGFRGDLEVTGKKTIEPGFGELRNVAGEKLPEQSGIFDETVKNHDVFLKFLSSWNVIWPDGYHDLRDAPYLIEIEDVPLIDILANPMYKSVKYQLRGGVAPTQTKFNERRSLTMKANIPFTSAPTLMDEEIVVKRLYHIWDKRERQRFTIAEALWEDTLFERDWNYLIEGFPYFPLGFNEIPKTREDAHSYPLSDVIPMLPQLRDLSVINDAIVRHGKRAGTVVFAQKGGLTTDEATAIQNAGDVDLIFLESVSDEVLKPYTTPALPSDWYKIRQIIVEDLMRISGFQQLLGTARGIETATESENLRRGETIIGSERIDIIEDFVKDIFRGIAGLSWQFLPRKRIAEIIGEPTVTEQMWPSLPEDIDEARKIIQKELTFSIDAGSTRPPKDEAVERKQWTDLAGTIQATFPNRIKADAFLKQWLKKFDFKDLEDVIISYDDEEIAIAQEENKLLMQGNRQLISPNENDMLHLQVHSQVYQTPGLVPTPEMDEHVETHAENMERKNPTVTPQKGDKKVSPQSTRPEQARGGVPTGQDLVGGATNILKGTGQKF